MKKRIFSLLLVFALCLCSGCSRKASEALEAAVEEQQEEIEAEAGLPEGAEIWDSALRAIRNCNSLELTYEQSIAYTVNGTSETDAIALQLQAGALQTTVPVLHADFSGAYHGTVDWAENTLCVSAELGTYAQSADKAAVQELAEGDFLLPTSEDMTAITCDRGEATRIGFSEPTVAFQQKLIAFLLPGSSGSCEFLDCTGTVTVNSYGALSTLDWEATVVQHANAIGGQEDRTCTLRCSLRVLSLDGGCEAVNLPASRTDIADVRYPFQLGRALATLGTGTRMNFSVLKGSTGSYVGTAFDYSLSRDFDYSLNAAKSVLTGEEVYCETATYGDTPMSTEYTAVYKNGALTTTDSDGSSKETRTIARETERVVEVLCELANEDFLLQLENITARENDSALILDFTLSWKQTGKIAKLCCGDQPLSDFDPDFSTSNGIYGQQATGSAALDPNTGRLLLLQVNCDSLRYTFRNAPGDGTIKLTGAFYSIEFRD